MAPHVQCMIGQALNIKSNIETRRSTNQFGIIVWQLNEIWPTVQAATLRIMGLADWPDSRVAGVLWSMVHLCPDRWEAEVCFAFVVR